MKYDHGCDDGPFLRKWMNDRWIRSLERMFTLSRKSVLPTCDSPKITYWSTLAVGASRGKEL